MADSNNRNKRSFDCGGPPAGPSSATGSDQRAPSHKTKTKDPLTPVSAPQEPTAGSWGLRLPRPPDPGRRAGTLLRSGCSEVWLCEAESKRWAFLSELDILSLGNIETLESCCTRIPAHQT